ncbi:MAG: DNA-3-methyladenine glycosylase I [Simkaniaceae bacterium]|nr:MAG: DNA-3-methyladenine glycosylase I [Simkaniaceae bacterium]
MKDRCTWAKNSNPLLVAYHDTEWGRPIHDDQKHFELLCLEGQQAGLSWEIVLKKRDAYRKIFHQFDPEKVAIMTDNQLLTAARDSGIIRHKLKVFSIRKNARSFLTLQGEEGSFDSYIWKFVEGAPLPYLEMRSSSPESIEISKALKKRGFSFVGPKIIYSYLQAAGLIADHTPNCFLSKTALLQ